MSKAKSASESWKQLNQQIVACQRCPRLRQHCAAIATEKRAAYRDWDYCRLTEPMLDAVFDQARARLADVR